ncbi:TonB-dependent receptor [Polaribacter sp. SA4-10]|uniref:TonB-dependent receptor n=1 Tax=Polaribacter sp. SA4-10 TaxID=754397 RepID=UPI000B3D0A8D|nr:TonB-dependent receptor [Polaribacter sp. SA4-10]
MMFRFFLNALFLTLPMALLAQQTVRGTITDKDSKQAIPFANILLKDSNPPIGTTSDENGKFTLSDVPIGKQTLVLSFLGYETFTLPNINVTAGKEVVLEINLVENFAALDEVVIVAEKRKEITVNEFVTVSARTLNPEQANLYAASIGDPARQVQNFAGVTGGGDDLNNEIVIRGNSPNTLLWRLEGVEVPNPNHFTRLTGGSVSMLSANVLAKTDFFTSAFPAEYGNGIAGVFDLRFRKGNNQKRETTIDVGVLGLGFSTEGYFSKKSKASYLVNYRYSTLGILEKLGLNLTDGFNPTFQDLNYNINLPTTKFGTFNLYGLLGKNKSNSSETEDENINGNPSTDNFTNKTESDESTFITGLGHRVFIKDQTYLKTNITYSSNDAKKNDVFQNSGVVGPLESESFDSKSEAFRLSSFINHKFNSKHTLRSGFTLSHLKEKNTLSFTDKNDDGTLSTSKDEINGTANVFQSYVQWKYRMTENFTLNSGLHFLHFGKTNSSAIEPRLGLNYKLNNVHSLSFGAGLHSRAEQLPLYLTKDATNTNFLNTNLKLSKALHYVVGYNWRINKNTLFKAETYYQHLFDIPVDNSGETGYNAINAQSFDIFEIAETPLTNDGKGRNYGIEFTLERFLNKGFYYLSTLSLYDSKYKVGNGNYLNTRFNGNYVFNLLSGKDFAVGTKGNKTFGINAKFVLAGGQRFTGIDEAASIAGQTEVFSTTPFTEKVKAYYRFDLGINYQWNKTKTTHNLSLNIQNITSRINTTELDYFFDEVTNRIVTIKSEQNGLIPVLKYSINF